MALSESGASTGAAAGAAIGSIIPGIGTLIGGAIGGLIGGAVGHTPKEHGKAIVGEARKAQGLLLDPSREVRVEGLDYLYGRLAGIGDCRGRGSGCEPHRAALVQAAVEVGVPIPDACFIRGKKGDRAAAGCNTAAVLGAGYDPSTASLGYGLSPAAAPANTLPERVAPSTPEGAMGIPTGNSLGLDGPAPAQASQPLLVYAALAAAAYYMWSRS